MIVEIEPQDSKQVVVAHCSDIGLGTDYGRPIKPFFNEIPNFWAWADNLGDWCIWYCEFLVHVLH